MQIAMDNSLPGLAQPQQCVLGDGLVLLAPALASLEGSVPRAGPPGCCVLLGCLCSAEGSFEKRGQAEQRSESIQLKCCSLCLYLLQPGPLPGCLFPFGPCPRPCRFRGHWVPLLFPRHSGPLEFCTLAHPSLQLPRSKPTNPCFLSDPGVTRLPPCHRDRT